VATAWSKGSRYSEARRSGAGFRHAAADALWREILDEVEKSGKGVLILMDEFLMWAHDAASPDPTGMSKGARAVLVRPAEELFPAAFPSGEGIATLSARRVLTCNRYGAE